MDFFGSGKTGFKSLWPSWKAKHFQDRDPVGIRMMILPEKKIKKKYQKNCFISNRLYICTSLNQKTKHNDKHKKHRFRFFD